MGGQFAFHAGERAVQQRAGEVAIADRNFSVMADTVIPGARAFIEKQFMTPVSSVDGAGRVWSSILFGKAGFLSAVDGKAISVKVPKAERDLSDPVWNNIVQSAHIGMLFIELGSRRRYRVNGAVTTISADGIEVGIHEAYPNCPKYIQRRHLRSIGPNESASGVRAQGEELTPDVQRMIRHADTLFVGSHNPGGNLDSSHRGGTPGFIALEDSNTLRIPDYHGNSLFNTFGNITSNPKCGIVIPDFEGNRLLHLTGEAAVHWDVEDTLGLTGGTKRFWDLKVSHWILRDIPQKIEWEYLDASPFNLPVAPTQGEF